MYSLNKNKWNVDLKRHNIIIYIDVLFIYFWRLIPIPIKYLNAILYNNNTYNHLCFCLFVYGTINGVQQIIHGESFCYLYLFSTINHVMLYIIREQKKNVYQFQSIKHDSINIFKKHKYVFVMSYVYMVCSSVFQRVVRVPLVLYGKWYTKKIPLYKKKLKGQWIILNIIWFIW